jgi:polygalacturonase
MAPLALRAAVLAAAAAAGGCARAQSFNVLKYGAVGDGVADDTAAVRAATAALAAAGGGELLFPAGYTFFCGPINVSSHAVVRVEGTFLASNNSADYELVAPLPWFGGGQDAPLSGAPEWSPVLRAVGTADAPVVNVTFTGGGLIDGNGAAWWACFDNKLAGPPCNGYSRPQLLRPTYVEGFSLYNLTLRDSPAWTIHLAWVTGAHLWNFTVTAPADRGNTDGVDPDCSRDVLIEDFVYAGGDDAVAIKAGEDWLGYTYGRPTVNVTVRRMTITSGNGYAIGSEMSAGVHDVTFTDVLVNCTAHPCKHATYIKTARGRGGVVSGVVIDGVTTAGNVGFAHGFTLQYTGPNAPPTNYTATPQIHNVTIANSPILPGVRSSWSFAGLNDSVITGVALSNVSVAKGVGGASACEFVVGTCAGVTPAGDCPPCFTRLD